MTSTVKVRIAVAVDGYGDWRAYGTSAGGDGSAMDYVTGWVSRGESRFWVTVDLPIPEVQEVTGKVTPHE